MKKQKNICIFAAQRYSDINLLIITNFRGFAMTIQKEILIDDIKIGNNTIDASLLEIPNGNYQCLIVNSEQNIPFNIVINK